MAYTKQTWSDLEGTGLNKYTVTESSGVSELTWTPDSITSAGTPVTADRMNYIEDGIESVATQADDTQTALDSAEDDIAEIQGTLANAILNTGGTITGNLEVNGNLTNNSVAVAKENLLYYKDLTRISSGEDLDNYNDYGIYTIPQNGIASSVANIPVASAGVLVVRDGLGTASAYRTQTYFTYDGETYYRWRSSGSWSAWQRMVTTSYLDGFNNITNIQEVAVSTSASVANNATGTLTGTLSNTNGSGTWYFIPVYFNYGFATAKPTLSGTTLSVTVMNSSGASHTLNGRVIAMRVKGES